ncbi:hypothetical protein JAAARDRAFT_40582 [Jaapia argillacea MUCL 33604]|uniref:Uncharacterized protein n=1 Tax=Jaapia argillacea MUCL 33604 TaxID=933084 RepID=A0A067PLU1_9AGAM|nr:hypothetical protein JAAARDRAFT_40582 [Jaapia argillacea MUCL 33604]
MGNGRIVLSAGAQSTIREWHPSTCAIVCEPPPTVAQLYQMLVSRSLHYSLLLFARGLEAVANSILVVSIGVIDDGLRWNYEP